MLLRRYLAYSARHFGAIGEGLSGRLRRAYWDGCMDARFFFEFNRCLGGGLYADFSEGLFLKRIAVNILVKLLLPNFIFLTQKIYF